MSDDVIKVAEPITGEDEIEEVGKVIKSGRFLQGPKVEELEKKFANYVGTDYAVATSSGTTALQITLAAKGIGPGDEVIVPALSFFSTATSVIHQNAIPIFADIDPDIYNLNPEDFEEKITEKTKAVIPVHLYGHPAEMDPIMEVAQEEDLTVIEDAAQAHGAEYKDEKVGSIGDAGCFSFYATKNMTTGEGGIITTDDEEIAEKARMIRSHGMTGRNTHAVLGYNYRMNEMEAAIGLVQLPKLDELNEKRSEISRYLLDNLKDVEWLTPAEIKDYVEHAFFWCPVKVNEEKLGMSTKELREKLLEEGVETRHRYYNPLYKQKMLLEKNAYPKECPFSCPYYGKEIDYSEAHCPNAEDISGRMIGLPNHPNLSQKELDRVIEVFKKLGTNR